MGKRLDLTGKRFGRLTALSFAGRTSGRNQFTQWKCRCDCGKEVVVYTNGLRSGHAKSCGCYKSDKTRARSTKHGGQGTGAYKAWRAMLGRCNNPKNVAYKNYGGRGIKVCETWERSFKAFLAYMGPRPPGMTIERKNNDGNYEPGNCKWATRNEQDRNKRTTVLVTINGRSLTLSEWALELNEDPATLGRRWRKSGVITKPSHERTGRRVEQLSIDGTVLRRFNSIAAAGAATGINSSTICEVCRGIRKTAGNYQWRYSKGEFNG